MIATFFLLQKNIKIKNKTAKVGPSARDSTNPTHRCLPSCGGTTWTKWAHPFEKK